MISEAATVLEPEQVSKAGWQTQWRESFRNARALAQFLSLDPATLDSVLDDKQPFRTRVPRAFAQKMRPGDLNDPLLLQVLAQRLEGEITSEFMQDPVGDRASEAVPGLLHKYQGRALVITTGACAVHCRYCFRRHFPYADASLNDERLAQLVAHLRADNSIEELLLSGGDPLSLDTSKLARITDALRSVPQLKRLRIHTRVPVVLPDRVDDQLCHWLSALPWRTVVVLHVNHAQELATDTAQAFAKLARAGVSLLNQAVLLRGVNNSVAALKQLSERLFEQGVLPYYLHLLDRVAGAAHFEVSKAEGRALMQELRSQLPGYLLPRLVQELAGEASKTPVD
jgi:EF-P beta-lysylation protein EpmB